MYSFRDELVHVRWTVRNTKFTTRRDCEYTSRKVEDICGTTWRDIRTRFGISVHDWIARLRLVVTSCYAQGVFDDSEPTTG